MVGSWVRTIICFFPQIFQVGSRKEQLNYYQHHLTRHGDLAVSSIQSTCISLGKPHQGIFFLWNHWCPLFLITFGVWGVPSSEDRNVVFLPPPQKSVYCYKFNFLSIIPYSYPGTSHQIIMRKWNIGIFIKYQKKKKNTCMSPTLTHVGHCRGTV